MTGLHIKLEAPLVGAMYIISVRSHFSIGK